MKRMVTVLLRASLGCSALFGALSVAGSSLAADSDLTLAISLDDSAYVQAAPILVAVQVKNIGGTTSEIPPVDPSYGYVELLLETRRGDRVYPTLEDDWPLQARNGLLLEPGGWDVQIIDLLLYYGYPDRVPRTISNALFLNVLPIGQYRLRARYSPSLDRISRSALLSNPVEFSIIPLSERPAEEQLVQEFLAGWDWNAPAWIGRDDYCQPWVPRFRDSQFLRKIYLSSGRHLRRLSPDFILRGIDRGKAISNSRAAVLGIRCHVERQEEREKLKWLRSLLAVDSDSLTKGILKAWTRRVTQGRFDYARSGGGK